MSGSIRASTLTGAGDGMPLIRLSPLNQRRWRNFKANKRAFWSLWIFAVLFGLSLFAELLANDKPLLVSYRGEWRMPFVQFYSEVDFGGDLRTEASYRSVEVQCLIKTGGLIACYDDPVALIAQAEAGQINDPGWMIWAPIPYSYSTIADLGGKAAPSPPDADHWFGTDDTAREVCLK